MMRQKDLAHLIDVVRAARLIVQFADEIDAESFRTSTLYQSAILHQFLVLGEATKRLSDTYKAQHARVPWGAMAGMRDRLIHGYDDVNLDVVWDTATHDVPALLNHLEPLSPPPDED